MIFSDEEIVAGTTLITEAIQSQNYATGTAGWIVRQDGTAEFSDVALRGNGVGDTLDVGPSGGPQVLVGSSATSGYIRLPVHSPKEGFFSEISAAPFNSGTPSEHISLQLRGPSVTGATDRIEMLIGSQNSDGTANANAVIRLATGQQLITVDKTQMTYRDTRITALGWCSVVDFGAVADGGGTNPTDNSPAFQAAINSLGQGGVVYVPPGNYRLGSTIVLALGVTLRGGGWNPHFTPRTNMIGSLLRPGIGNFSGTELIRIDPATVAGTYIDSAYGGGPRIEGLALNGRSTNNATGGAITGIAISDSVHDAGISDVTCWQFTGDGVKVTNSSGIEITRVVSTTNGGNGFNFVTGATDTDLVDCYSQGNAGDGYVIPNPNAISLLNCRSEFNAGNGYTFTGLNYSSRVIGCNTDRSGQHGFNINTLDGGHPMIFVGCEAKRDGSSGTTYAGFNVVGTDATTQAAGAIFQGCSAYVSRNDDGTGNRSPAYGIQTQFTRRVQVSGGYLEGTLAAYNDTSAAISKTSGIVQAVVDPTTGSTTISNSDRLAVNGSGGSTRSVQYWTRGGGERWEARANGTAEAGANTGSDYEISRWSDAGAEIDIPFRITRSTGDVRLLGNLRINSAGKGLQIAEGANAKMGTAVLTGSTPVIVNTAAVTASSRIFLTAQSPGGTPGHFWVSSRTAGNAFAITGTAGDTSTVAWLIIEP